MTGGHWRALVSLPPSHRISNQYKSSHIPLRVMVPPVLTYFNFGIICSESFCSSLKLLVLLVGLPGVSFLESRVDVRACNVAVFSMPRVKNWGTKEHQVDTHCRLSKRRSESEKCTMCRNY